MSSQSAVGYIDQSGSYRATYVRSLSEDPYGIFTYLLDVANGDQDAIEKWIDTGIEGGGYASTGDDVLNSDIEDGVQMPLITADNYDQHQLNFVFLVEDAVPEFYDPKGVLRLDPNWLR